MLRVQDVHLNGVLSILSVLSIVQPIKWAHSCVRDETYFEICFVGTLRSNLVPLLPLRGTIYCLLGSPSLGGYHSCLMRRFHSVLREDEDPRFPHVPRGWMHVLSSTSHVPRSFPLKEAGLISFTCIYIYTRR